MSDLFNTPMDSRTIAMILKDAETLQLQGKTSDHLLKLAAERHLKNYFQLQSTAAVVSEEELLQENRLREENYKKTLQQISTYHLEVLEKAKADYERALTFANARTREKFEKSFQAKMAAAEADFNLEVATLKNAYAREKTKSINQANAVFRASGFEVTAPCRPVTAEEFYQLAMSIKQNNPHVSVKYCNEPASKATLNGFVCILLHEAAKAGHILAKNQLIEATIQGDSEARKFVELKDHVIAGMHIKLPRKLITIEEIRKLGSDLLIQYRKRNFEPGRPLSGNYYEIADGAAAGQLGQRLLSLEQQMRRTEIEEKTSRAHTSIVQAPLSANGMFAKTQDALIANAKTDAQDYSFSHRLAPAAGG